MTEQINFKNLLGTGAHFGHVTRKWHPNYSPYILMERNGVHIINLEETVKHLNIAIDFVKTIVEKNGEVLFVGTKKQAKDIVQQEADRSGMYYIVERWLGGTLTNFSTIKKSIKRLKSLEKEGSSIYENLTKKEIQMLNRERLKLSDQHRGIKDMRRLPDVIVIVDVEREVTALEEAIRLEIPVIAIVDTNCDPRIVDYPIPANDDSIRTIQLIISAIVDGIVQVRDDKATSESELAESKQAEVAKEKSAPIEKKIVEKKSEVRIVKLNSTKTATKDESTKEDKAIETSKPAAKIKETKTISKTISATKNDSTESVVKSAKTTTKKTSKVSEKE